MIGFAIWRCEGCGQSILDQPLRASFICDSCEDEGAEPDYRVREGTIRAAGDLSRPPLNNAEAYHRAVMGERGWAP